MDDQPVNNVQLVIITLVNPGSIPIVAEDFKMPIVITFGENARILGTEITTRRPKDLPVVTVREASPKDVKFSPLLLNSGDYFTFNALVGDYQGPVEVHSRVVGVKEITDFIASRGFGYYLNSIVKGFLYQVLGFALFIAIVVAGVLLVLGWFNWADWLLIVVLVYFILLIGLWVMILLAIRDMKAGK
jgi:hypothetical protein